MIEIILIPKCVINTIFLAFGTHRGGKARDTRQTFLDLGLCCFIGLGSWARDRRSGGFGCSQLISCLEGFFAGLDAMLLGGEVVGLLRGL